MKEKINEAAEAAEKFTKIYYEHVDAKKPTISKLYMETGLMVYNGNGFTGPEAIVKFIKDMPTTKHELVTMDAQPIMEDVGGQKTILIQVSGTVRISNQKSRAFQQSFLITAVSGSWKIVTDTFRLQDGIRGEIKLWDNNFIKKINVI